MPTKPRRRMDIRAVPWMTARYYSLTLKRALSGDDLRRAVCQPCVHGTRPRVVRRESHAPHVARHTERTTGAARAENRPEHAVRRGITNRTEDVPSARRRSQRT